MPSFNSYYDLKRDIRDLLSLSNDALNAVVEEEMLDDVKSDLIRNLEGAIELLEESVKLM